MPLACSIPKTKAVHLDTVASFWVSVCFVKNVVRVLTALQENAGRRACLTGAWNVNRLTNLGGARSIEEHIEKRNVFSKFTNFFYVPIKSNIKSINWYQNSEFDYIMLFV